MITILGLDPGSKQTGYCVLGANLSRGALMLSRIVAGTIGNEGMAEWIYDEAWMRETDSGFAQPDLSIIAIEKLEGIAFGPKGAGIVPHLISASNAAGVAKGAAQLLATRGQLAIHEASARTWRSAVVGKANASDAGIKVAIQRLVPNWPKVSNSHERDAAGVAIHAARVLGLVMLIGRSAA